MKNKFIENLKNPHISFSENQQEFELLKKNNQFENFIPALNMDFKQQVAWYRSYFDEQFARLDGNFSAELSEHLIEVKKYFQENEQYGFSLNSQAESAISFKNETKVDETVDVRKQPENQPHFSQQAVNNAEKFANGKDLNFQPSAELADLVRKNDLREIRNYLMSLLNNRRIEIQDVVKTIWYVYQQLPAVFEIAEESAFVKGMDNNEVNWNLDYFSLQQVYLNYNFTLDRLFHLVNVRQTLQKKGDKDFQQIRIQKKPEPQPQQRETASQRQEQRVPPRNEQQVPPKREQTPPRNEPYSEQENSFMKTALLIGGAVLAAVIALFAIFK